MSRNPLQNRLISIVEPVVQGAGLELVDLRFLLEQGGWVLRVQIDTPTAQWTDVSQVPSERVSLTDCENMSRELSAVLDVDDPITQAYHLEISSPGIDRPLRTAAHFTHFAGSEAKIQLAVPVQLPAGERRNFKGILKGVVDGKVAIDCDGTIFELVLADIETAKLVPDWDAVMRGQSGAGAANAPKPIKPGHRPSQKPKQKQQSS
jgi:ribosome maturation factor RimP